MKIKLFNSKKGIGFFEIIIMILSVVSFSYIVSDVRGEEILSCCIEGKEGEICQDVPYNECNQECKTNCQPTRCENIEECKLGCCYDSEKGICNRNVPKYSCEKGGGIWNEDASCNNVYECELGCCVLNGQAAFVTAKECEMLTKFYGLENYDFRQQLTEIECVALEKSNVKGACTYETEVNNKKEIGCKITNKEECIKLTGSSSNFYEGYLCTNPDLNTICKPTNQTICNGDEVYFVDSCGNTANIYDANKIYNINNNESVEYWKRIFTKNESCNVGFSNINSKECGNCDYLLGSRCEKATDVKPRYGDYICRDLNCHNVPLVINGKGEVLKWGNKKNGESWCIYENTIGNITQEMIVGWTQRYEGSSLFNRTLVRVPIIHTTMSGSDPVGSRHFIASCIDGNYTIQPCDQYRNYVCVEGNIKLNNQTNETFSSASCVLNIWQKCLEYNIEDDLQKAMEECKKNDFCYIKRIDIDDGFKFDFCLPKYKPGFDFSKEEGNAKSVCDIGSLTCKVVYVKKLFGGWKCKQNCDCLTKEFTLKMNEFCRSLGDCGANVNVVGKVTDGGYNVKGAPRLSSTDLKNLSYSRFENPEIGKKAEITNLTNYIRIVGLPPELAKPENLFGKGFLGGIVGGLGVLVAGIMKIGGFSFLEAVKLATFQTVTTTGGATAHLSYTTIGSGTLNALAGALALSSVFYIFAKAFGLSEGAAIGAALAGAVIGFSLIRSGVINITTIVIAVVIAIILSFLFGGGKTKVVDVKFTCMPYQRPLGGEDCHLCNENKYLPCNRYKCESLGSACKLLNEDSDKAMCVASENDGIPPIIHALRFENYTYNIFSDNGIESGYEIKNKNGECFEEWSNILISVSTNEPSQCKIDFEGNKNYDEMEDYFDSTLYEYNHTLPYRLPSLSFLGVTGFNPFRTGEFKFYVKCQDDWGNKNLVDYVIKTCVKPGKDTTPPTITKFVPEEENAYVAYNQSTFNLIFYTNEPAECKWDFENKDYEEMINYANCSGMSQIDINSTDEMRSVLETYMGSQTIWGFPCESVINGIEDNKSIVYIKCKDQPWYADINESLRNANRESIPKDGYKIKLSRNALKIVEILPKGEIIAGVEPFTINLKIKTEGGVKDGEAKCEISFDNETWIGMIDKDPAPNINLFEFNQLIRGHYKIYVKCKDIAGNVDYSSTEFTLNLDTSPPQLTRVYANNGILYLFTDEDSECVYSNTNCYYIYENGTKMSGSGKEHIASIKEGKNYYIKCKDIYGNLPSECTIKVKI